MKPREIAELLHNRRPPPPYGSRRLARAHSIADLARLARRRLPAAAFAYLEGGGEDERTLRRNREALDALELVPRVLRDVTAVDTATTALGTPLPVPFVLAPVGAPRLFHHDGELAVARAASRSGIAYAVSTLATNELDDIAAAASSSLWFQLYLWGDRGAAKDVIERARSAGYRALLVTVDCTVRSKRERELRAGLTLPTPHLSARTIANAARHPSWSWHFLTSDALTFPNITTGDAAVDVAALFDGSATWADLDWIRASWPGPIALKGVLAVEDARHAADAGIDAVVVSNHGGRQLDHVPATIDVLPAIVDAVGDRVEVLFDSGIRRGTDIAIALALGARAVLLGRAYLYGLGAAGEAGVCHAIDILTDELRIAMALVGASTLDDLERSLVHSTRVLPEGVSR